MTLRKLVRFSVGAALTGMLPALVFPCIAAAADEADTSVGRSVPESPPKVDWADRVREAKVRQGEPIMLIVHSAKDCIFCRRWEGSLGGQGDFESWAKTHPDAHLFIVEREAVAVPETVDSYPPQVQWLFERRQQLDKLSPRTPTFEIFVKRKIVWRSSGLHSWERDVFPALKDLDSRRVPTGAEEISQN